MNFERNRGLIEEVCDFSASHKKKCRDLEVDAIILLLEKIKVQVQSA